jgi:hypothetical protein
MSLVGGSNTNPTATRQSVLCGAASRRSPQQRALSERQRTHILLSEIEMEVHLDHCAGNGYSRLVPAVALRSAICSTDESRKVPTIHAHSQLLANMGGITVERDCPKTEAEFACCDCHSRPVDAEGLYQLVTQSQLMKHGDLTAKSINDKSKAN